MHDAQCMPDQMIIQLHVAKMPNRGRGCKDEGPSAQQLSSSCMFRLFTHVNNGLFQKMQVHPH